MLLLSPLAVILLALVGVVVARRRNFRTLLAVFGISITTPCMLVAMACARYGTESTHCVWGQALLPLYVILATLAVAPLVFLTASLADWLYHRIRNPRAPHA